MSCLQWIRWPIDDASGNLKLAVASASALKHPVSTQTSSYRRASFLFRRRITCAPWRRQRLGSSAIAGLTSLPVLRRCRADPGAPPPGGVDRADLADPDPVDRV